MFRVYNNFALASSIASALNTNISVYDQSGATTASTAAASQLWAHMWEDLYGESTSGVTYNYTSYPGNDTPVGGTNSYTIEAGTDGSSSAIIRAGTNNNGYGFVEISSRLTPPSGVIPQAYQFYVVATYQWTT